MVLLVVNKVHSQQIARFHIALHKAEKQSEGTKSEAQHHSILLLITHHNLCNNWSSTQRPSEIARVAENDFTNQKQERDRETVNPGPFPATLEIAHLLIHVIKLRVVLSQQTGCQQSRHSTHSCKLS